VVTNRDIEMNYVHIRQKHSKMKEHFLCACGTRIIFYYFSVAHIVFSLVTKV